VSGAFAVDTQDAGEDGGGLNGRIELFAPGADRLGGLVFGRLEFAGCCGNGLEEVVDATLFGETDVELA